MTSQLSIAEKKLRDYLSENVLTGFMKGKRQMRYVIASELNLPPGEASFLLTKLLDMGAMQYKRAGFSEGVWDVSTQSVIN